MQLQSLELFTLPDISVLFTLTKLRSLAISSGFSLSELQQVVDALPLLESISGEVFPDVSTKGPLRSLTSECLMHKTRLREISLPTGGRDVITFVLSSSMRALKVLYLSDEPRGSFWPASNEHHASFALEALEFDFQVFIDQTSHLKHLHLFTCLESITLACYTTGIFLALSSCNRLQSINFGDMVSHHAALTDLARLISSVKHLRSLWLPRVLSASFEDQVLTASTEVLRAVTLHGTTLVRLHIGNSLMTSQALEMFTVLTRLEHFQHIYDNLFPFPLLFHVHTSVTVTVQESMNLPHLDMVAASAAIIHWILNLKTVYLSPYPLHRSFCWKDQQSLIAALRVHWYEQPKEIQSAADIYEICFGQGRTQFRSYLLLKQSFDGNDEEDEEDQDSEYREASDDEELQ